MVHFDMAENNTKTSYGVQQHSFSNDAHNVIILYSVYIFPSNLAY